MEQALIAQRILRSISWNAEDYTVLDKKYTSKTPHIALEYADNLKDKDAFEYIFAKHPSVFKYHIDMTTPVFGRWNFDTR